MVMKPPCEMIVKKVLPSIRAAIVKAMREEYNMKQTAIAEILGISQSAVSQYYSSTRATDHRFSVAFPEIMEYASNVSDKMVSGVMKSDDISLCEPCQIIRKNKKFAEYHEEFKQLAKCNICKLEDQQ